VVERDYVRVGRPSRVRIATAGGAIEISWGARSTLLDRLRGIDRATSIRAAFLAVGASKPVELDERQRRLLVEVIDDWATRAPRLPAGIWDLRNAFLADLIGAEE
jgi:hypothetical protein